MSTLSAHPAFGRKSPATRTRRLTPKAAPSPTGRAFRPVPRTLVTFDLLVPEAENCDAQLAPERCHFYHALTDYGG